LAQAFLVEDFVNEAETKVSGVITSPFSQSTLNLRNNGEFH